MLTSPPASTGLALLAFAVPAHVRPKCSQNLCSQLLQCHCREYWTLSRRAFEARIAFNRAHGKLALPASFLTKLTFQVLCSVMKWCWSRLPGGVVSWDAYELFRVGEHGRLLLSICATFRHTNGTGQTRIRRETLSQLSSQSV